MRLQQCIQDFYIYPEVGSEDWRYVYQTAEARAMEMQLLARATLLDMANAADYQQAVGFLSTSEYAAIPSAKDMAEVERTLLARRAYARQLFEGWILDGRIRRLFRSRDDLANIRLALKRMVTKQPIGNDYSPDGNVPADRFSEIFQQQEYELLPDYMQQAIEQALMAYYQAKDTRRIDIAIDQFQATYNLQQAYRLGHIFLINLFRIQIDLDNIRTMFRQRLYKTDLPGLFIEGGFLEIDRLTRGMDCPIEAMAGLFYYSPYARVVEEGVRYFQAEQSFLKLEQAVDEHILGFLRSTAHISSGPQPIIGYLLMKEHQIRMVRLILLAKRHHLETKLILDRLAA